MSASNNLSPATRALARIYLFAGASREAEVAQPHLWRLEVVRDS